MAREAARRIDGRFGAQLSAEPAGATSALGVPSQRELPHLDIYDYEGVVGDRTHMTRKAIGRIPTDRLTGLTGARDEVRGEHRNRQDEAWAEFLDDIQANGIKNPLLITVDYGQEPVISEGNHRLDAAFELGLDCVPVEIRWFGHAEYDRDGLLDGAHAAADDGNLDAYPDGYLRVSADSVSAVCSDYRGQHRAPSRDGYGVNATDLTGVLGDHVYDHPEWSDPDIEAATVEIVRAMRGNPELHVTVYRSAPAEVTSINPGDWVTIQRSYAEQHGYGMAEDGGDWPVIEIQVRAGDLWSEGSDLKEYGWDPA